MKIVLAAIIVVMTFTSQVCADELCQFKDIPFGTKKNEVLEKLNFKGKGSWQAGNSFYFTSYNLGDRNVTLVAEFDDNDSFYRFVFNFNSYVPDEDGIKVIKDDFLYVSTIFTNKYGIPAKTYPVDKFKLIVIDKPEPLQEWKSGRCRAYSGIGKDFQKFNATAAVFDSELLAAQAARRENRKLDGLNRAIKDL